MTTALSPRRLLTVAQLAERLAVPERTVYRMASEGLPGSYRIRRSWRFDEREVLDALRAAPEPERVVVDLTAERSRRAKT